MLFRNDIFKYAEQRYRVLAVDAPQDRAWVIGLDTPLAWPEARKWSLIASQQPVAIGGAQDAILAAPTPAHLTRSQKAFKAITPLLATGTAIYNPADRSRLVKEQAAVTGLCDKTLRQYLREYWQGGQNQSALYGNWHKCGRSGSPNKTTGRGRRPTHSSYTVFEVHEAVRAIFDEGCKYYLQDERHTIVGAYKHLLRTSFSKEDGNGKLHVFLKGDRPTLRQFDYFLRKNYELETRLRARKGNKEFERNHRPKLGSSRFACEGVGDIYEIDATIADIFVVAPHDRRRIVGKPTVYIIIDRRSGLIVGFYVGLENASWNAARLAILSVVADKAELCRQYGVAYDPEDWPAHAILPSQFCADRGEMISNASSRIVDGLNVTVTNTPGLRPDWKPFVECGFKLLHQAIAEHAPGFDPANNFTKRRGKHYEKDACLTLHEFTQMMLEHVIAYNRRPKKAPELTVEELMEEVMPAPINLWNFGISTRSGYLSRYSELEVQYELLPTEKAVVTEKGILFRHCYYTCKEAIEKGWFTMGRKRRFNVDVSYDPRLADAIYVRDKSGKDYFRADLTESSRRIYAGLTFDEVHFYKAILKRTLSAGEEIGQQTDLEYVEKITPTIENAEAKFKQLPKKSRSARKADIKDDRMQALQEERQTTTAPLPYSMQTESPSESEPQPGLREPRLHEVNTTPLPAKSLVATLAAQQRNKLFQKG
jgi:hypothetical protein